MPFDIPEENQDETAIPAEFPQVGYRSPINRVPGAPNPHLGADLSRGILPLSTSAKPTEDGLPATRIASLQTRSDSFQPQPSPGAFGIGRQIVNMGLDKKMEAPAAPIG